MKIFVGYASNEGQTRKIARHILSRLADAGHAVELIALSDASDVDLAHYDAAILGASLHAGHYQKALSEFAHQRCDALNKVPALLVSVSLAAAGHDADDWSALDKILADFKAATGWHPAEVAQVAGAYKPSDYDIVRRFIMRRIIAEKDPDADLDANREYTDWAALDKTIDTWLTAITRSA